MAVRGGRPNDRRLTAHLMVPDVGRAIDYYRRAMGAEELYRSEVPGMGPVHAHLKIADSTVMLTRENLGGPHGDLRIASPNTIGGATMMCELYVDDADAAVARATEAGARVIVPLHEAFYGDRYGVLQDPFGHLWALATMLEELTPEEIDQRARARFAGGA